jgi:hypothetical protein
MLSSKDFSKNMHDPLGFSGSDIQYMDNRDDFDDAGS